MYKRFASLSLGKQAFLSPSSCPRVLDLTLGCSQLVPLIFLWLLLEKCPCWDTPSGGLLLCSPRRGGHSQAQIGSVLVKLDLVGTWSLFVRMKLRGKARTGLVGKGQVCVESLWNALESISLAAAKLWRCSGRCWARLPPGQVPLEGLAEVQELLGCHKCQLESASPPNPALPCPSLGLKLLQGHWQAPAFHKRPHK